MKKKLIKLLSLLRTSQDFISGEEISNQLGVSRTSVWKYIKQLKELGYRIEGVNKRGYRLLAVPDRLLAEEIYLGLETKEIGRELIVYNELGSTNEEAKSLARQGAQNGLVILAEKQLAGKGRLGRKWFSPAGTGLWLSILLRPELAANKAPFLTIVAALAVAKTLTAFAQIPEVGIKWPNDILIKGKKVCGILAEMNADLERINYAVVGIGLNVNTAEFPQELEAKSTSLFLELGTKVERIPLLQKLLLNFEHYYQLFLQKRFSELLQEWKNTLGLIGKELVLYAGDKEIRGKVVDISEDGALLIRQADGKIQGFWAGDVSLKKN